MTATELKIIREKMKYSMADFCILIGIKKPRYQRYENGTAKIAPELAEKITAEYRRDRQFMSNLPAKIGAMAAADFPQGIKSEVE